ncbi:MAG: hypothetical protein UW14_C0023G0004 [Candidatus Yanofskybacteria bacterium GW2011_GWA2_44_10]|nr:MAG: hypothetical protein UW14_C0023G0004 [Candidatus Yanofskybacteria bacterium GW2011_GWA2_44_10]
MADETNNRKLFGNITGPKKSGGHTPSHGELVRLLSGPDSEFPSEVANVYCAGCGEIQGVNADGAAELSKRAGVPRPEDFQKKYFEVQGCIFCSDNFEEVVLKRVI